MFVCLFWGGGYKMGFLPNTDHLGDITFVDISFIRFWFCMSSCIQCLFKMMMSANYRLNWLQWSGLKLRPVEARRSCNIITAWSLECKECLNVLLPVISLLFSVAVDILFIRIHDKGYLFLQDLVFLLFERKND